MLLRVVVKFARILMDMYSFITLQKLDHFAGFFLREYFIRVLLIMCSCWLHCLGISSLGLCYLVCNLFVVHAMPHVWTKTLCSKRS